MWSCGDAEPYQPVGNAPNVEGPEIVPRDDCDFV